MATFNYELSESEIKSIARDVNKRIDDQISNSATFKELSEKTNQVAKSFASTLMSDAAIKYEIKDIIKPLVIDEIKTFINNSSEILKQTLEDYFRSDNFKRKELHELRKRVEELESELE